MRLYQAKHGWTFYGTQADARAACGRDFEQVEVPTDKAGLIDYLNGLAPKPVEVDAPAAQPAVEQAAPPEREDGPDNFSTLRCLFDMLPLARQLDYARLATDRAQRRILA